MSIGMYCFIDNFFSILYILFSLVLRHQNQLCYLIILLSSPFLFLPFFLSSTHLSVIVTNKLQLQFESKFGGKFIEEFHGERGKNIKGWDECKEKMRLKSEYYFISSSLTSEDEGGKEEEQPSQPPQSSKKDDGKNDESKKQRSTSTLPTPTSPELEAEPKTNATHAEMVEFDIGEKVFAEVGMGKTDDWYFGEITAKGNTPEDGRLYYAVSNLKWLG